MLLPEKSLIDMPVRTIAFRNNSSTTGAVIYTVPDNVVFKGEIRGVVNGATYFPLINGEDICHTGLASLPVTLKAGTQLSVHLRSNNRYVIIGNEYEV